jgi:predicted nucleic acid-binding protein
VTGGGVYLDSSALVKLVAPEPETDALRGFLGEPRRTVLISELTVTEVTRAARRVGLDATPALDECDVVLLRSDVLVATGALDPPTLRTLDAIQLATALSLGDAIETLVAYDERLAAAAAAHGLRVAAPV